MLKKIKHGWKKVLAILLLDLALYNLSILLAIYIKHEFILVLPHANFGSTPWLLENAIFIIFFFVLSIPLEIWNFTSLREAIKLGLLVFSAKALALPLYYMIETVPYRFFPSIYVISTVFVVPLLLIPRAIYRLFWEQSKQQRSSKKREWRSQGDYSRINDRSWQCR